MLSIPFCRYNELLLLLFRFTHMVFMQYGKQNYVYLDHTVCRSAAMCTFLRQFDFKLIVCTRIA